MRKVLDKAEKVGVTLIRESGEEVKGVIDHGENAADRLVKGAIDHGENAADRLVKGAINHGENAADRLVKGAINHGENAADRLMCRFFDETNRTVELTIDRAAGKIQLLSDDLTEKAYLLLEAGGDEVRLSLDHMQKNAIMILDHMPRVAGEAAQEAADGAVAGLRHQFQWGPALPMLVTQIDRALRSGKHVPHELVELVWTQPDTQYQEKYNAYRFLMKFFQVNTAMTAQQRFAVQFFISFVALQDHVPQGYIEWARGKRNPGIYTAELLKLPPGQEHLRDRAVEILQNMGNMTQGEIADTTFRIMTELQPPQLQLEVPREAPREDPREACKKGLKVIDGYIQNADNAAVAFRDKPEKDAEVNGMKVTIQQAIDQLKANHPTFLSPGLESCPELYQNLLDKEGRCQKIEAQRSKAFFFRQLERENRFWPKESSRNVPESMPLSVYLNYWNMSEPKTQTVAFESLRWKEHYLDASTGKPDKGDVYVTRGSPSCIWAQWKKIHLHDYVFAFESLRWKEHYLDASTGKKDKCDVYVTRGSPSCIWAQWKRVHLHDDVFAYESLRWKEHYLDASTGKPDKGDVYVTRGSPSCIWAQWRTRAVRL